MTTFTQTQDTRTSVLSLGTLGSLSYIASSTVDLGPNIPLDVTIEAECVPNGAPTGNMQLVLFVQLSLDGINFGTGGTTVANEPQLHWIGSLPTSTTAVTHRKFFSLQGLPIARYFKIVVKNDMGVSLTSGNIYCANITGTA